MSKFWAWLVYSSTNADKLSLTVKGAVATGVALIANLAVFGHLQLNVEVISTLGDSISNVFQAGLGLITAVTTLVSLATTTWALVRKIIRTFKGDHEALNDYKSSFEG